MRLSRILSYADIFGYRSSMSEINDKHTVGKNTPVLHWTNKHQIAMTFHKT